MIEIALDGVQLHDGSCEFDCEQLDRKLAGSIYKDNCEYKTNVRALRSIKS